MARQFNWRSDGRATWPRWKTVIALELSLAIIVIGVGAAHLLPQVSAALTKARMVEALNEALPGKIAVVEHFAVTGRSLETDVAGQARAAESSGVPEYEKHLSAALAFAAVAAASGQAPPKADAGGDGSPYKVRAGVRNGSVVMLGRLLELPDPYSIVITPAVARGDASATVQWVCGDAPQPADTILLGESMTSHIPRRLLFHPCRGVARP